MNTTIRIKKKLQSLSASASAKALAARFTPSLRIPAVTVHPVLSGGHKYLRALRAAEMAAWEAGLPFDVARSFAESIARGEAE